MINYMGRAEKTPYRANIKGATLSGNLFFCVGLCQMISDFLQVYSPGLVIFLFPFLISALV